MSDPESVRRRPLWRLPGSEPLVSRPRVDTTTPGAILRGVLHGVRGDVFIFIFNVCVGPIGSRLSG